MGRPKIHLRPTPIIRKTCGQFKKLFGLWENKPKPNIVNKKNPQLNIKEGNPEFLNNNSHVNDRFVTRRQVVLNRHFTEIISDVLLVNLRKELNELGVSITSIETKAWNKGVRIFYSSSKPFDQDLHDELSTIVNKLKSAITERNLIGRTPRIDFVYDKNAELIQNLNISLESKQITPLEKETTLQKIPLEQLKKIRWKENQEKATLDPKAFSAPKDMVNMMLGIDYPVLYNQVISRFARGRAESSRMLSSTEIASLTKPLYRAPISEEEEVDDARSRVLKMQKFLVSQRKKNEYLSRSRRKQELLHRDEYKWDLPRDDEIENDV